MDRARGMVKTHTRVDTAVSVTHRATFALAMATQRLEMAAGGAADRIRSRPAMAGGSASHFERPTARRAHSHSAPRASPLGTPPLGLSCPKGVQLGGGPGHLPGDRGVVINLLSTKAFNPLILPPSGNLGPPPRTIV